MNITVNGTMSDFRPNFSQYKEKDFINTLTNPLKDEIEIINNGIEKEDLDNLTQGILLDKFASIYEEKSLYNEANSLYQTAINKKINEPNATFEIFKTYIALQKTYNNIGKKKEADDVEKTLKGLAAKAGYTTKPNITKEQEEKINNNFIKVGMNISKNLLKNNHKTAALYFIQRLNKQTNRLFNNEEIKTEAEIYEKNDLFDLSTKSLKKLFDTNLTTEDINTIKQQIINNKISNNDLSNIEALLSNVFSNTENKETLVENLISRALIEKLNDNEKYINNFINLAVLIENTEPKRKKPALSLMTALLLRKNGQKERSSEICKRSLDSLTADKQMFSNEYPKLMMVLAQNTYDDYLKNGKEDKNKLKDSLNLLKNAQNIASKTMDNDTLAQISICLAGLYLEEDDFETSTNLVKPIIQEGSEEFQSEANAIMGNICLKQGNPKKAEFYFEQERKQLIKQTSDQQLINQSTKSLIQCNKLLSNTAKVESLTKQLVTQDAASYLDLMNLAEKYIESGDFENAESCYEKASKKEEESESSRAYAQFHLGATKWKTKNDAHGLKEIESAIATLEKCTEKNAYENPKETHLLIYSLNFAGTEYYRRMQYEKAATVFSKVNQIFEKQHLLKVTDNDKKDALLKTGSSYYKAKKYKEAIPFLLKHIKNITDGDFSINRLGQSFIDNVIETKNRKECAQIAAALEMLGVIHVKSHTFTTAGQYFTTALKIREAAGGNRLLLANDYKALARLHMVANSSMELLAFKQSKDYLEKAIEIEKAELGVNSEITNKDQQFYDNFFGTKLKSLGKYLDRGLNYLSKKIGIDDSFQKEIINDFHLIYEGLNLCE